MRTAAYQNCMYHEQIGLSQEELFEAETELMQLASRLAKMSWAKAMAVDLLQGRHLYKISVPAFRTWVSTQHKLIDNLMVPEVDTTPDDEIDEFKAAIDADVEEAIRTGEFSELDLDD